MNVTLRKATINDANIIHDLQIRAFADLLAKYHDFDISPGAEKIEKIIQRLEQEFTDYYLIYKNYEPIGAIRIVRIEKECKCRISPIFILPEYQNKGIAQTVFKIIEEKYSPENGWCLETILEETGNCYLYEKMGYKKTGKIEEVKENMHLVYYEKA